LISPKPNGASVRYLSGARLDSTTLPLSVDVSEVRRALAVHPRLALSPSRADVRGTHPIVVDLFRVTEGRIEAGGTDQHRLSAMAGGSFGAWYGAGLGGAMGSVQGALAGSTMGSYVGEWLGPVGSLLGAATGWMAGGAFGALAGLAPGVSKGARLGAAVAGRASRQLSDTIGTYDEILIGVPDVVVRGDGERRHFFVLGMYTNSAIARWGDRTFAFGYRKQPAIIVNEPFRGFQMSVSGRTLFTAEFSAVEPGDWRSSNGDGTGHEGLFGLYKQPLLGITERGQLSRSRLDRSFTDPAVRFAAPVHATVTLGPGFATGLPGGSYSPPPLSASQPWGLLHARSVMSRVTFPTALPEERAPRRPRPVR
jgi:hypothetical protein